MKKRYWIALAMLACLFAGRVWQRAAEPGQAAKNGKKGGAAAVAVEAEPVCQGQIRDVREFNGTLQPRARFVFAPKVAGRLEALAVNIGDEIAPGQLVAKLDDGEYVQELNQARASVDVYTATVRQQETQCSLAKREMERIGALREKKIAAESDWDKAEAEYKAALAQVEVAKAQKAEKESALEAAKVRKDYTSIAAPAADPTGGQWRVEARYVDVGAMLAANTPIVSVVDISSLLAVIRVIQRDYPLIAVGQTVEVETDAFAGKTFTGKVKRIAPALNESSLQARVDVEIPNEGLVLRPGMFVRARLEFARRENATLIPFTALVKRNGKPGVFLVDEAAKTARFQAIEIGIETAEMVEVVAPELKGRVVTLGNHLLTDGTAIILTENAVKAKADTSKAKPVAGVKP